MCSWLDVSGGGILKGGELCARSSSSEPPLSALLSSISWANKKWTRPPGRAPAIPAAGGGTSKAPRRGAKKAPPGAARQIQSRRRAGPGNPRRLESGKSKNISHHHLHAKTTRNSCYNRNSRVSDRTRGAATGKYR